MKRLILALCAFAFVAIGSIAAPDAAQAACGGTSTHGTGAHSCYAIATGNWGTSGTWSNTSGGASCACTPVTGDTVVFDANSGGSAKTYTMEAAYSLEALDASAANSNVTLTQNAFTLTITGNYFALASAMVYTPSSSSRALSFTSTSGTTTIAGASKTFGNVTFNGVGGTWVPDSNGIITRSDSSITLTNGTLDLSINNGPVTTGGFLSNNSNTRVITLGSNTITINGNCSNSAPWDFTTTTGLTFTKGTSTIAFTPAPITGCTFATGAQSYNIVTVTPSVLQNAQFIIGGAGWTIANLTVNGPAWIATGAGTLTNSSFVGTDNSHMVFLSSSSINGTVATLTMTNAPTTATWLALLGITFAGAGSSFSATNCIDLKGNTAVTCVTPAGASGGRIIGG